MNSAIDKFVDTGKFSFGDFANSVIRDIIKIQMKANVANIIGGVNSSGGLINMISGLFRAEGGSVKSGQPYIVGEKGPEMFVPNSGGNIIPNKMLGSGQNTPAVGAPTINYNISAVDANSFKVMLAQDPNFLYAVTEQGRKSLPQTRR
jgi:phage-related minor tail protein